MDGDIGAALESVLSDPAQMEKLTKMAQELFGKAGEKSGEGAETQAQAQPTSADAKLLGELGKAFSGKAQPSRSTALLLAMRPYMRPEKQEKLDRAMKIARMAGIAGAVMRQYGGGEHGV